jgi:transposase
MLNIRSSTKVFLCSQVIDMRYSFDALSGLVTTHFGVSPLSGHIFVFLSRSRDRMKLLFWDSDGFALYYKRLERGSFAWVHDLDLNEGGEIHASDFAMILAGINPQRQFKSSKQKPLKAPHVAPRVPV